MTTKQIHTFFNYCIAAIWIVNGLICKILHLVPRHQQIVATVLGSKYSQLLTVTIGLAEILMGIWIISNIYSRLNAIVQILIIAIMNILEFLLVPDLLLWGRTNAIFALLLIIIIYWNEFHLNKKISQSTPNAAIP